jgi:ABC-type antimicrobial peptide transport system permease subunit
MVSTAEGLLDMIKQQRRTARIITIGIGILTLILAGGGIINLTMLSIRQRYREIGIMRACGAKRDDIFYLFLIEGHLLSIYGLCFGGAISVLFVGLSEGCRFDIFINALFWSGITCVPLGLCGYYPGMVAASISPCEAIST